MNIRLYNAKILTMCEDEEIFEGEVWIQGDRILYVGKGEIPDDIYADMPEKCII